MASYNEKFQLETSFDATRQAWLRTIAEQKWKLITEDRGKIVAREGTFETSKLTWPVTLEIKLIALSEGTGVDVHATNVGIGPGQTTHVESQVKTLLRRMPVHLQRIQIEQEDAAMQAAAEQEAADRMMMQRQAFAEQERERKARVQEEYARLKDAPAPAVAEPQDAATLSNNGAMPGTPSVVEASPAAPPPSSHSGADFIAELEKLAQLHQLGVLTADEFRAAKQKLWGCSETGSPVFC